jgi:hypothetical protein
VFTKKNGELRELNECYGEAKCGGDGLIHKVNKGNEMLTEIKNRREAG